MYIWTNPWYGHIIAYFFFSISLYLLGMAEYLDFCPWIVVSFSVVSSSTSSASGLEFVPDYLAADLWTSNYLYGFYDFWPYPCPSSHRIIKNKDSRYHQIDILLQFLLLRLIVAYIDQPSAASSTDRQTPARQPRHWGSYCRAAKFFWYSLSTFIKWQ